MFTKSTAIGSHRIRIVIPVIVAVAAVSVLWANAGTLDPPVGPIAPTMHSLDEIYASVAALGAPASSEVVGALEVSADGSDWPGPDDMPSFSGVFRVLGFIQGMTMPFDLGSPGGDPAPAPLTVALELGPSTVLAFKALVKSESIIAKLHLIRSVPAFRGDGGGTEHYFDIELQDARVVSVQTGHDVYNISFSYTDIKWTDIPSGTIHRWVWSSGP